MRRALAPLAIAACGASLLLAGAATRPTAAAFTAAPISAGATVGVDTLANHFAVAPGSAVQAGTAIRVATGNVDSLALAFGVVPSPRTFVDVFTVENVSGTTRAATLEIRSVGQVESAVFARTGTPRVALAPGEATSVSVTTSSTVAGRGSGTIRLGLSGSAWLYRDYAVALDQAPSAPAALTATAKAGGAVRVAWTASATATNLDGYNVYRSAGGGPLVRLNASAAPGTSYDDAATTDGTSYVYVVRAVASGPSALESVDSPSAEARADAVAPAAPSAVALANGGGRGAAYVNAANAASLAVDVSVTATSSASDALTVTISAGSSSVSKTVPARAGAGTVRVAGIDASSLADGTVTIRATAADAAGNASSAATASAPKDTVAPAAPAARYTDQRNTNDQITGTAEPDATVLALQSLPTTSGPYSTTAAANGSYTVTVALSKGQNVAYAVTATDAAGNASVATTVTATTTR